MKFKLLTLLFLSLFTCISMHAQVAQNESGFEFKKGKFYQDGVELTPTQLCTTIGQQTYDTQYISGMGLRKAGIISLYVGGGLFILGGGLATYGFIESGSNGGDFGGGTIAIGVGLFSASVGAVAAITGGILLGVGNKRLRNIVPASNGAGLALVF